MDCHKDCIVECSFCFCFLQIYCLFLKLNRYYDERYRERDARRERIEERPARERIEERAAREDVREPVRERERERDRDRDRERERERERDVRTREERESSSHRSSRH